MLLIAEQPHHISRQPEAVASKERLFLAVVSVVYETASFVRFSTVFLSKPFYATLGENP